MRNSTLGLTALLGCLLLGGCDKLNSPPKTSSAPNGMQTEAPTQTQENAYSRLTRRVNGALVADPWRLENEEQQALVRDLLEGLTIYDPAGKVIGGLAESWQTQDNKLWRFNLRENLHWANGALLTAAELVQSFQALAISDTPLKQYLAYMNLGNAQAVLSGQMPPKQLQISAPDERTLIFQLDKPTPYLPAMLAHAILLPHVLDEKGELQTNGAYLQQSVDEKGVHLVKNPHYYDLQKGHFAQVDYLSSSNSARADIFFAPPQPADNAQYFPKLCSYFYEFNLRDPRLQNAAVRKAIASLISVRSITDNEMPHAIASSYFLPKAMLNGQDSQWEPVVAEQLLAQQKIDEHHPLQLHILYDNRPLHQQIANRLTRSLAQSDMLRVSAQSVDWPQLQEKRVAGEFQLIRSGWCADFHHPMAFLSLFYSHSPDNKSGYADKDYDRLFEQALKSTSESEQAALYLQLSEHIQNQNLLLPLFQYTEAVDIAPDLGGVGKNPVGVIYSKDLFRRGAENAPMEN